MKAVLVGYPNVGKSSLFNCLVGRREAVVDRRPGVTRDRKEGRCPFSPAPLTVVDTGGIDEQAADRLAEAVRCQARAAVGEADLVLLICDGRTPPRPGDLELAQALRRSPQPVWLVVNKCERPADRLQSAEYFKLGLGEPLPVSAASGEGIAELKERLSRAAASAADTNSAGPEGEGCRLAVVGRPNVGKSSLVNRILGAERMVVFAQGGTTVDAVDCAFSFRGQRVVLVDTAGLRRSAKREDQLERAAAGRALEALRRADVGLLVCDCREGVRVQDLRIASAAFKEGKPLVVVANKWDLFRPGQSPSLGEGRGLLARRLRERPPLVCASAKTGHGVERAVSLALSLAAKARALVPTPELNRVLGELFAYRPPPAAGPRGRRLKLLYALQTGEAPPSFLLFVNSPSLWHQEYGHYLENRLRERYGWAGVPLRFTVRGRRHHGAGQGSLRSGALT